MQQVEEPRDGALQAFERIAAPRDFRDEGVDRVHDVGRDDAVHGGHRGRDLLLGEKAAREGAQQCLGQGGPAQLEEQGRAIRFGH
jgi:hypothetical protein